MYKVNLICEQKRERERERESKPTQKITNYFHPQMYHPSVHHQYQNDVQIIVERIPGPMPSHSLNE
jgi:hypothetical protein